jgi:hypothetical protein
MFVAVQVAGALQSFQGTFKEEADDLLLDGQDVMLVCGSTASDRRPAIVLPIGPSLS